MHSSHDTITRNSRQRSSHPHLTRSSSMNSGTNVCWFHHTPIPKNVQSGNLLNSYVLNAPEQKKSPKSFLSSINHNRPNSVARIVWVRQGHDKYITTELGEIENPCCKLIREMHREAGKQLSTIDSDNCNNMTWHIMLKQGQTGWENSHNCFS